MSAVEFDAAVEWVSRVMEGAGVAVLLLGAAAATARFLHRMRRGGPVDAAYRGYRRSLGRAILLGLEFLVAGDIIYTVAVESTFRSVGVLAILVVIRTFLSAELELEINGRWPWQRAAGGAAGGAEPLSDAAADRPPGG